MRIYVHIIQRTLKALGLGAVALPVTLMFFWQLFLLLYGPPDAAEGSSAWAATETQSPVAAPDAAPELPRETTDDAGCSCPADDMATVELRVQTDGAEFRGHAFLKTPRRTVGFLTDVTDLGLVDYLNPFAPLVPGYLRDDSEQPYNYVVRYRACPTTVERLEVSITRHARAPYQVGNWAGGRNCATWAQDRLRDAGLRPPSGHCPNQMAWNMPARGSGPHQAALAPATDRK